MFHCFSEIGQAGRFQGMQVEAVIVAAGSATRFGGDKLTAELCGRPVLGWTLAAFEAATSVDAIVLVVNGERLVELGALGQRWAPKKFREAVAGGERRRDSVEAGLRACHSRYVAIQDGARPLVTPELVDRVVARADREPGAIAAIRVTDTIKEADGERISGHPERARLWAAQTPQVVLRQAWLDAARSSDNDETDDAAMLSRLGLECVLVEGSAENIKVTRPLDLEVAAAILRLRGEGR
jgi:2-C-methyl-D-erythritol 4-phosphate cytidylyltransferase